MSIITAVYVPEGIVLAGDSRLTRCKEKDVNGTKTIERYTLSDNAQKVLLLSKTSVGIASCGSAIVGDDTVADYIRLFEIEEVNENDTVEEIAQKLCTRSKGKGMHFFVCGYQNDVPHVYDINDTCTRFNIDQDGNVNFAAAWNGKKEAITRLFKNNPPTDINCRLMTLKDGIDLAEFIVSTTINYERFKDDLQTCGGPIDILVIQKDKAFWNKNKNKQLQMQF